MCLTSSHGLTEVFFDFKKKCRFCCKFELCPSIHLFFFLDFSDHFSDHLQELGDFVPRRFSASAWGSLFDKAMI